MTTAIVLATSNPHKVEELRALFGPLQVPVLSLEEAGGADLPEPVEDGETFADNARIKACYYAKALGMRCLADDSGLEVDALGGEPGVRSARYAGVAGDRTRRDAANNALLLSRLAEVPEAKRTARFVCAMCLADAAGIILAESRGVFEGVITLKPAGSNGFGYDPLLYLPERGCTSAELDPAEKNRLSHRGAAARKMVDALSKIGGQQ